MLNTEMESTWTPAPTETIQNAPSNWKGSWDPGRESCSCASIEYVLYKINTCIYIYAYIT